MPLTRRQKVEANQFSDPHGYNITLAEVEKLNNYLLTEKGIQCDPNSILVKSYDSRGLPESSDFWLKVKHQQGEVGEDIRNTAMETVAMGYFANYLPLSMNHATTISCGQLKQELENTGGNAKREEVVIKKFFPDLNILEWKDQIRRVKQGGNDEDMVDENAVDETLG